MKNWPYICAVVLGMNIVRGDDEYTPTSVSHRASTSAKPTTIYNRINVQRVDEKISNTPLDLFKLTDHELRRSQSNIWNWDYWCQLQPKMGNCTQTVAKYYYDAQLDQCVMFQFSGCNGNKNNFDDIVSCERHCKGATFITLKDTDQKMFCGLQPNSGLCMALYPKFYYDINEASCKAFVYGGCGGNQNRFESIALCMGLCRGSDYLRSDLL